MDPLKLQALYALLCEYATLPDWNREGPAWAVVEQARKQVEIDLRAAGVDPAGEAEP